MATSMRHVKRKERLKKRNKLKRQGKKKHGFLSDQAWKPFEVDMAVFADEEMEGFVGMEVLTNYNPKLLQKSTSGTTVMKINKSSGKDNEMNIPGEMDKTKQTLKKQTDSGKGGNSQTKKIKSQSGREKPPKMKSIEKKKTDEIDKNSQKKLRNTKGDAKLKMVKSKDNIGREAKAADVVMEDRTKDKTDEKKMERINVKENEKKMMKGMKGTKNTPGIKKTSEMTEHRKNDSTQEGWKERRKRKSGRERLDELRMKRRRRIKQIEGETEEQKPKHDQSRAEVMKEDVADSSADVSMTSWGNLTIPSLVHKALQPMGFTKPTPIQEQCIAAAMKERRDIVGAAETGSGKTLAFGIPLIYWLLKHKATGQSRNTNSTEKHEAVKLKENIDGDADHDDGQPRMKDGGRRTKGKEQDVGEGVKRKWSTKRKINERTSQSTPGLKQKDKTDDDGVVVKAKEEEDDETEMDILEKDDDIENDDDDADDSDDSEDDSENGLDLEKCKKIGLQKLKSKMGCVEVIDDIADQEWTTAGLPLTATLAGRSGQLGGLFGLVLTPTRELAVQVKNHLVAAAKFTDIKVAVVVGGMSAEKQKRVLKKKPDIIVGTPGRLWELFQLGEPHLCSLPNIQCLVIDEADRMVEKGHYAELSEILDLLNSSEKRTSRQIFVFSATLTMIHLGPMRKSLQKAFKMDKKEKLDSVMAKVGVKENAHVVDLTKKEGTASTLLESKIVCEVEEKDIYLFYFLRQYPGRTLVFTNSIDCIRRLVSILILLECQPFPLHSSMHQKQRLKNLERFTSNPRGLLLATDVAARGLDIPDIEHVIHYQVPRTSESYVHRSGRTARQAKTGLSVTLVSPGEINFYRRLCKTLNREEIPSFPIEQSYYKEIKERVEVARDIDKLEHVNSKKKHQNDWFVRAAKELDVDLDENMDLHDMGDSAEQKQFNKKMKMMRAHLKSLLKKKIFASGTSQLYLTSGGKLVSPLSPADGSHQAVSKLQARINKDKTEEKTEKEKKRKKFKRMGRYKKQES